MAEPGRAEGGVWKALSATRCARAVLRIRTAEGPAFQEAVDRAVAELEQAPAGLIRTRMAEELVRVLLGSPTRGGMSSLRHLDQLVRIGDEVAADRPGWRRLRAMGRSMALMRTCADRGLVDYRAATDEVDRLAVEFADDPDVLTVISAARAVLTLASGAGDVATVRATVADFSERAAGCSQTAPIVDMLQQYTAALWVDEDADSGAMAAGYSEFIRQARGMPDSAILNDAADVMAPMLDIMRSLADGPDHEAPARPPEVLQNLTGDLRMAPEQRAFHLAARGMAAMRQGAERDPARIKAAIADLRTALELVPEDHPQRVLQLTGLALAVYQRSEITGSLGDVDEAVTLLDQARELAGGPAHPQWSFVNDMLAQFRRRRGEDSSVSRRTALEGLRGHTWKVLLQPDPASARAVARAAAEEAVELAARFLGEHEPADALRALDAGRGLMLFAATELRDPCTRLVEAGEPELARRWQSEEPPSPLLRREVLQVLSRETGLLDPPDLEEIQAALSALDADALVYLVPAAPPVPGFAVIAPVEGQPRYLSLPHLVIGPDTDIERYLRGLGTRDVQLMNAGPGTDTDQAEFRTSVEVVCDWAWKAAMRPIVKPYRDMDRIPHLVLIPMGELARVPWQAARGPDGEYLVEWIALSQAASARMLCDSAAAERVPLTSSGLVVADPDTGGAAADLPSARLEAYAIRQAFYPSASYLGRLPNGSPSHSGAGTPDDVRAWLRADEAEAGVVVHLASHGVMETALDSAASRLLLAGGSLTADELIGILADSPGHRIGLAVLAACHTGRSVHGYDEAYSLATMFLAAGARSVLSTQWSIPDQDTSLLMYMFHHYLIAERHPPWDALRRAQIWMLDATRTVPDRMPEPLRRTLEGADPTQVMAWAGFVHWGQ